MDIWTKRELAYSVWGIGLAITLVIAMNQVWFVINDTYLIPIERDVSIFVNVVGLALLIIGMILMYLWRRGS